MSIRKSRLLGSFVFCASAFTTTTTHAQIEDLDAKVTAALPKIEALAEKTLTETGVPAIAMVVVYKGEVVLELPLGVRRVGSDEPVDANTRFEIASLSKPMSSTLAAIAVDKGYLDWDDPVVTYDPGFRINNLASSALVSVADFISHRSGLPGHAGDKLEDLGYTRHEIAVRNRLLPDAYLFREGYDYTNAGFTQGGIAVARAAGMPFEDLAEELLFTPLGMTRSSYRFRDYINDPNHASIHVQTGPGIWEALYTRDADEQAPAGGLSTTLNDYAKWMRMQLAKGDFNGTTMINPDALDVTWQPHSRTGYNPATGQASFYGLGWNLAVQGDRGLNLSHSGAFDLGVRTSVSLYPDLDLGIAVFLNGGTNGIPEGLTFSFWDYVFDGELSRDWIIFANEQWVIMTEESWGYGGDYTTPPPNPVPAKPDSAYIGTYTNAYWGDVTVYEANGGLVFDIGPRPETIELSHWDGDVFLFQPIGEMAGPLSKFTFVFEDGDLNAAASVDLEYYGVDRDGVFPRKQSWLENDGWARLAGMAFAYVSPAPIEAGPAAWLWVDRTDWQGWAWTAESTYPWLYDNTQGEWIYFGDITIERSAESGDTVSYWFYHANGGTWSALTDRFPHINAFGISDAAGVEYLAKPFGLEAEWPRYTKELIDSVTLY